MHTKLTDEQQQHQPQQNTKPGIRWKCLLKIPATKYILYWEKKDKLIHLSWKDQSN